MVWPLLKLISKTLFNTKRRISLRGSFVKSKEKHLKQGEKKFKSWKCFSKSYLYTFDYLQKDFENICKNKTSGANVVQNVKNQIKLIYLEMLSFKNNLCTSVKMQTSYISALYICFSLCWHQSPKRGRLKYQNDTPIQVFPQILHITH